MLRDTAVSLWESKGGGGTETLVDDWSREGGAHPGTRACRLKIPETTEKVHHQTVLLTCGGTTHNLRHRPVQLDQNHQNLLRVSLVSGGPAALRPDAVDRSLVLVSVDMDLEPH